MFLEPTSILKSTWLKLLLKETIKTCDGVHAKHCATGWSLVCCLPYTYYCFYRIILLKFICFRDRRCHIIVYYIHMCMSHLKDGSQYWSRKKASQNTLCTTNCLGFLLFVVKFCPITSDQFHVYTVQVKWWLLKYCFDHTIVFWPWQTWHFTE